MGDFALELLRQRATSTCAAPTRPSTAAAGDRRAQLARGRDRRRHAEHPEEHHRRAHPAAAEGLELSGVRPEPARARRARISRASQRQARPDPALKHAAVAATLVGDADGRACFLITRRASGMRNHPGQWALPGGRDRSRARRAEADRAARAARGARARAARPRRRARPARRLRHALGLRDHAGRVLGRRGARARRRTPTRSRPCYVVPVDELDRPEIPQLRAIPESDRPVLSLPDARCSARASTRRPRPCCSSCARSRCTAARRACRTTSSPSSPGSESTHPRVRLDPDSPYGSKRLISIPLPTGSITLVMPAFARTAAW